MKYFRLATAVAMAALGSEVSANVITIPGQLDYQAVSFDSVAPVLMYDEFDLRLGTLDSVDITFTGVATIQSQTQTQLIGLAPAPYTALITLNLGFDSVSRGFETTVDSVAPLTVAASGTGAIATTIMPFSFSFTIDDIQDYGVPVNADPDGSGSASAMTISASRADFLPVNPLLPGVPVNTSFTASTQSLDPRVAPFMTTLTGAMQVEYWYTKEIEIPAVPLPAAAWLFGPGLFGLIGIAKRKKAT